MGLFDKMFSKKMCDLCGADMGIVKDNKLEDGAICKDCAAKLSPWFREGRTTTLAEIKEQLAYREENKAEVAKFNITRTIGSDNLKILVDDDASRFVVTSARNLEEANPDVLDFAQVTGCDLDIRERRNEERRKKEEGGFESYNPPRYRVYYDFYITIYVNHKYFNEIEFKINSYSVETTPSTGAPQHRIPNPELNNEYREYKEMGEEIIAILTDVHRQAREDAAPKAAMKCPYCGATTVPNASGCCEFCGGPL